MKTRIYLALIVTTLISAVIYSFYETSSSTEQLNGERTSNATLKETQKSNFTNKTATSREPETALQIPALCQLHKDSHTIVFKDKVSRQSAINKLDALARKPETAKVASWYAFDMEILLPYERELFQADIQWLDENAAALSQTSTLAREGNIELASSLWTEFANQSPDKSKLKLFSKRFYNGAGIASEEEITRRLDLLTAIGAPISADILVYMPSKNIKDIAYVVDKYKIYDLELNPFDEQTILEVAISRNNIVALEYLLSQITDKLILNKAFNYSIKFSETTHPKVFELLWSKGARPIPWSEAALISHLKQIDSSILPDVMNYLDQRENAEKDYFLSSQQVESLVGSLQDARSDFREQNLACASQKYRIYVEEASEIFDTIEQLEQSNLNQKETERALSVLSRTSVEIYRELSQPRAHRCTHANTSNVQQLLDKNIEYKSLSQCIGQTTLLDHLAMNESVVLGDKTLDAFLSGIEDKRIKAGALEERSFRFVLDNYERFLSNGFDLNYSNDFGKGLFYKTVEFNNPDIAMALLKAGVEKDLDELGFDALDYFLLNHERYPNLEKWKAIFQQAEWPIRESHNNRGIELIKSQTSPRTMDWM